MRICPKDLSGGRNTDFYQLAIWLQNITCPFASPLALMSLPEEEAPNAGRHLSTYLGLKLTCEPSSLAELGAKPQQMMGRNQWQCFAFLTSFSVTVFRGIFSSEFSCHRDSRRRVASRSPSVLGAWLSWMAAHHCHSANCSVMLCLENLALTVTAESSWEKFVS